MYRLFSNTLIFKIILYKLMFFNFITKYVINIIMDTLFHITACISPLPISSLGPSALGLIQAVLRRRVCIILSIFFHWIIPLYKSDNNNLPATLYMYLKIFGLRAKNFILLAIVMSCEKYMAKNSKRFVFIKKQANPYPCLKTHKADKICLSWPL